MWHSFYLCPENLSEVELKLNEQICLAEEIIQTHSIEVASWILLIGLSRSWNDKGHQVEQKAKKGL